MRSVFFAVVVFSLGSFAVTSALGNESQTPGAEWTLKDPSPRVRDYFFRIDVDPGESHQEYSADISLRNAPVEPSATVWLRVQRVLGRKKLELYMNDGFLPVSGLLQASICDGFDPCSILSGYYDWKVGHHYRFRSETRDEGEIPGRPNVSGIRVTLTDLTTGTADILGYFNFLPIELIPKNTASLRYTQGPTSCTGRQHFKVTVGPSRGDWGSDTNLASASASMKKTDSPAYTCSPSELLPGMKIGDMSGKALFDDASKNATLVGNLYTGIHRFGDYENEAKTNMVFAVDPDAEYPYLFRALKDGKYGDFPAEGEANADWQSIGKGYPLINDLVDKQQTLKNWDQKSESTIGQVFVYRNPYTHDLEYFKQLRHPAGYFPLDRRSNEEWSYIGRHSKPSEKWHELQVRTRYRHWSDRTQRFVSVGDVFVYPNPVSNETEYFKLKLDRVPGNFPTDKSSNKEWEYLGTEADPTGSSGVVGWVYSHESEGKMLYYRRMYDTLGGVDFPSNNKGMSSNDEWTYLGKHP